MCDHARHNSDFYIRTCFADASAALSEIEKGRAIGGGLCLREACHRRLDLFGRFLLSHAGKVLFVWMLMVATFSVGLKSSQFTYRLEGLWLPDSGRIGEEVSYTMSYLGETDSWNNLMVIQMPDEVPSQNHYGHETMSGRFRYIEEDADDNILTRDALIAHLNIIKKASQVSVQLFDQDWKLKDLCHSATMPTSDSHYVNRIFENISPCNIITPLDCFWEGSKLLGPDYPVHIPGVGTRKWTNLDPQKILAQMKDFRYNYQFHILEEYLNKSGITTAYQYKPCLDPDDSECPETAPNYRSKEIPDIAALMNSGCYGYATKYMHWPEQLILGGVTKNKTHHILRAKALQTVIQIMGTKDMYEFWSDGIKVNHIGWNQEKAEQILDAWQKRFSQEVKKLQAGYDEYNTFSFSMATLNESLKQHTKFNIIKLAIVVSLLMIFCMFMGQYIAVFGVIMLIMNTIAGLGFCSLLGVPLNILTIQVVPFLCVGLSLRDVWILLHSYKLTKDTRQTLKQCTPNIIAHNLYLSATFIVCIVLPVPALKACAMQCAVLTLSNAVGVLTVFPGILSIDQRRKQAFNNRVKNYLNRQGNYYHQPPTKRQTFSKSVSECCCESDEKMPPKSYNSFSAPAEFLLNRAIKLTCLMCLALGIFMGIYHAYHLKFSLEMPEFLPRNCSDYKYLKVHEKYFGFYSFSTVTMNINYPYSSNQYLIKEYHNSIANTKNVLSSESISWLEMFQNYLWKLQEEFEENLQNNCLNSEKWYKNATKNAILAYKLLANTGNVNHPIEKSEILTKKLITNGLIEEEPYYNYLSAWFSNDPIVSFMQNTFRPIPRHFSDSDEYDLKIPKTKALKYVETQYYVEKLHSTDDIIELIQSIRKTSESFNEKGMKNYPKGIIFAFYDQFIDIYQHFAAIFGANFLACFICSFILLNFNTSLFLIAFKMILIIFLAIGYHFLQIDMNIVFVMTTSVAITILGRNLIVLIEGFVTSIGNRERRTRLTIELNMWPLFQGNLSLLISIAVFYTSDFDFIRKYLFYTFIVTIIVDSFSTFLFFPIFLSCFGPKPMLIPLDHADRIATPSPIPSPVITRKHHHHHNRSRRHSSHSSSHSSDNCGPGIAKQQTTREPSLTTITEESGCSITVQPEVVVQTTTYSNQNDSNSSPNNSQHVTTKVTATANIKVEVHSRPNSRREDREP